MKDYFIYQSEKEPYCSWKGHYYQICKGCGLVYIDELGKVIGKT
jgi:hypothetical protein